MSEQYPEVNEDESGIVPSQGARVPEWPKKIRTLTASELDRLTIDGSGRFYWDGQLVNYEPPEGKDSFSQTPEAREQSAMDIIDRAVHDLSDHRTPTPIEGAELPATESATDLDLVRVSPQAAVLSDSLVAAIPPHMIRPNDVLRVRLSRWQALGAVLVVLGILAGAVGVAARGFVAVHDWGCRNGAIHSHCPIMPAQQQRPDIPA